MPAPARTGAISTRRAAPRRRRTVTSLRRAGARRGPVRARARRRSRGPAPTPSPSRALHRPGRAADRLSTALAAAYTGGAHGPTGRLFAATATARRVDLPTYAFQRGTYWLERLPAAISARPGSARPATRCSARRSGSRRRRWRADRAALAADAPVARRPRRRRTRSLLPGTAFVELACTRGATRAPPDGSTSSARGAAGRAGERRVELQVVVDDGRAGRRGPSRSYCPRRRARGTECRRPWLSHASSSLAPRPPNGSVAVTSAPGRPRRRAA